MVSMISFLSTYLHVINFFASTLSTIDIKCSIEHEDFEVIGNIQICNVTLSIYSENQAVGLTNLNFDNTEGVVIEKQVVYYLPRFRTEDLSKFRVLAVINSQLKKISSVPLLGINSLEYFDVSNNNIEYIPGNLFQFNPAIKVAIFDHNNIKAINTNSFVALQYLGLKNLTCYSGTAQSKSIITDKIKDIKLECLSFSEDYSDFAKLEDLKTVMDNFDQLHDDVQTIKILTSLILTIILLAVCIFIIYLLRIKISQTFSAIRDKIYAREDDSEIIIEETSSINYASCSHINETFSESTNNMETSAIYDSVYVESTVVEDDKAKVVGLMNITPNSTNYASVEEILTHLVQETERNNKKIIENGIVWEKSKLFKDKSNENLKPDISKEIPQSHKIGSLCTNAIFEHESICQANANQNNKQSQSNDKQKSIDFIKSEQMETLSSNGTQNPPIPAHLPSESSDYANLPSQTFSNPNQDFQTSEQNSQPLTRQNSNQKLSYKTKIPQSMNPKTLNLANIDEKITHFEQTSPVFADVAQKLMTTSTGSQKAVNHFGFRSLTFADVAQKIGGQSDSTLKRQNSNLSDQKLPIVKNLAKKFSEMEGVNQRSPTPNTNPFREFSDTSNDNADYAEPFYRTSNEAEDQNVSEYAEPYQSQNN